MLDQKRYCSFTNTSRRVRTNCWRGITPSQKSYWGYRYDPERHTFIFWSYGWTFNASLWGFPADFASIRQGTRANIVDACLKSSSLWRLVQEYRLTTNMRVALQADERAEMFANKLLRLGNGETDTVQSPDYVFLLNFGTPAENIDILLDRIYPQIHSNYENHTWLIQRAILAPHNDSVSQINKLLAEKLPT